MIGIACCQPYENHSLFWTGFCSEIFIHLADTFLQISPKWIELLFLSDMGWQQELGDYLISNVYIVDHQRCIQLLLYASIILMFIMYVCS